MARELNDSILLPLFRNPVSPEKRCTEEPPPPITIEKITTQAFKNWDKAYEGYLSAKNAGDATGVLNKKAELINCIGYALAIHRTQSEGEYIWDRLKQLIKLTVLNREDAQKISERRIFHLEVEKRAEALRKRLVSSLIGEMEAERKNN